MSNPTIEIVAYRAEYGFETVKMIRASFQKAMSLEHNNGFNAVSNHLKFFSSYDPENVRVAIDTQSSVIAGCMVQNGVEIDQLYVHNDYQRNGIGSRFMEIAKNNSSERLELFTFQQNIQAQNFYKKNGFVEKARGIAPREGNRWAVKAEQLADIRFVWSPL